MKTHQKTRTTALDVKSRDNALTATFERAITDADTKGGHDYLFMVLRMANLPLSTRARLLGRIEASERAYRRGPHENPDWAALRASAAKHGRSAWEATKSGSKKAYAWSKPHAAKAWAATKAGTKRAAIATAAAAKRGAKKAAPHVARGMRSMSERLDRYAVANPGTKCLCAKNPSRKLRGAAKVDFVERMAAGRRRAARR